MNSKTTRASPVAASLPVCRASAAPALSGQLCSNANSILLYTPPSANTFKSPYQIRLSLSVMSILHRGHHCYVISIQPSSEQDLAAARSKFIQFLPRSHNKSNLSSAARHRRALFISIIRLSTIKWLSQRPLQLSPARAFVSMQERWLEEPSLGHLTGLFARPSSLQSSRHKLLFVTA